jgi:hypothetical protein
MRWSTDALRRMGAAGLLYVLALVPRAHAVVINTLDDQVNRVAPADDPGWNNVGRVGSASGVYLGNRWVLTANHVGSASLRLSDGRTFAPVADSGVRLQNTGSVAGFGGADLFMYRLAADPGLPAVSIAASAPAPGERVSMIGAGLDLQAPMLGWQTTAVTGGLRWTEAPLVHANTFGFALGTTSTMRWGYNHVSSASTFDSTSDRTWTFSTRFDPPGTTLLRFFEAQAVVGDSGGGVFHEVDGQWQLSGIMVSQDLLNNQPAGTVVFGGSSNIADLSKYREQILELLNTSDPLWQNPANPHDVDSSGVIAARDFLIILNELIAHGAHPLSDMRGASDWYFDVNGDNAVSAKDALAIANLLLARQNSLSASSAEVHLIPEGSTLTLAAAGLSWLAAAGALRRCRAHCARSRRAQ